MNVQFASNASLEDGNATVVVAVRDGKIAATVYVLAVTDNPGWWYARLVYRDGREPVNATARARRQWAIHDARSMMLHFVANFYLVDVTRVRGWEV